MAVAQFPMIKANGVIELGNETVKPRDNDEIPIEPIERDAHDREAGTDADGVDQSDEERRPRVTSEGVEARRSSSADARTIVGRH